mmetsp:Transcript_57907/g.118511  ORF Transcript_57907/g.118511 Transcript_57907/m.118511 type:complete len:228 (+) Transcript_57907:470-1153(+)
MATLRSEATPFRRAVHLLILSVNRVSLSFTSRISPPSRLHARRSRLLSQNALSPQHNPPRGIASIAPSSSGSEYSTTDCRPPMPLWYHDLTSWINSGAATTYGTFLARRICCASSAWRAPSIEPAGPPTSGNPIVETTASTLTASGESVGFLGMSPLATAAVSNSDVRESRTAMCPSTPVMKSGSGVSCWLSMWRVSSGMYASSEMTCLRYSSTPTVGHDLLSGLCS